MKADKVPSGTGYCITGYLEATSDEEQSIIQIWLNVLRDLPVEYCDAESNGRGIILFDKMDVILLKQILEKLSIAIPIEIVPLLGITKKQREINDLLCKN